MLKSFCFFTFLLFLITLTSGIFPKKVLAQTCPGQVSIDRYACNPVAKQGICDPPYFVQNESLSCRWTGNSCQNLGSFCSSNDDCVYNTADKDCYCNGGPVDCNDFPPPGGGGGCETSAPSGLAIDRDYSALRVNITWNPGSGGTGQAIFISDDPQAVYFNCTQGTCVVRDYSIPSGRGYYRPLKTVFDPNTVYYVKVVEIAGDCSKSTTKPWLSNCSLTPASKEFLKPLLTQIFSMPLVDTFNSSFALNRVTFSADTTTIGSPKVFSRAPAAVSDSTVLKNSG
jgi:hypothetical protein